MTGADLDTRLALALEATSVLARRERVRAAMREAARDLVPCCCERCRDRRYSRLAEDAASRLAETRSSAIRRETRSMAREEAERRASTPPPVRRAAPGWWSWIGQAVAAALAASAHSGR